MKRISSDMKESPQYEYEDIPVEENQDIANGQLDGYIEGDSVEYKWSPHPELESPDAVEDDTPEELYNVEDKKGDGLHLFILYTSIKVLLIR